VSFNIHTTITTNVFVFRWLSLWNLWTDAEVSIPAIGGSRFIRNVGAYTHNFRVSHHRTA